MKLEVRNAVIAACAAMFVEGFYATMSFPFASFLVEHLRGKENLGTMTGLFFTAFPIGSLLTANRWGDVANYHGRRACLLLSVSLNLLLTLGIAFCPVYEIIVILRLLQGATNCTLPMTRTCLRERIQQLEGDEVRAFSLLQTAYAASVVLGPAIGGFLYGLPGLPDFLLPWALPHLLSVAFYVLSFIFSYAFMVETVDMDVPGDLRRQSSREVRLSDDFSIFYYFIMVAGHSYVFTGWEVGYPLLARNEELEGWSSAMIGVTFLVGSVGLLLHTLISYPIMVRSMGLGAVWSSSWSVSILVLCMFPRLLKVLVLRMGYDGQSGVVLVANYVAQLFISVLQGCNFTTLQFILNRLISLRNDSEYALPLANGWTAALQAVARAISPSMTGTLMSQRSLFGGIMAFDALAVIATASCWISGCMLEKSLGKRVSARESGHFQGSRADLEDYNVLKDGADVAPKKSSLTCLIQVLTIGLAATGALAALYMRR